MKKIFILFLFITSNRLFCFSQTTVPAGSVNGNWTLAGSPYQIMGAIQIPSGQTLSIDPGVTINFKNLFYKVLNNNKVISTGKLVIDWL